MWLLILPAFVCPSGLTGLNVQWLLRNVYSFWERGQGHYEWQPKRPQIQNFPKLRLCWLAFVNFCIVRVLRKNVLYPNESNGFFSFWPPGQFSSGHDLHDVVAIAAPRASSKERKARAAFRRFFTSSCPSGVSSPLIQYSQRAGVLHCPHVCMLFSNLCIESHSLRSGLMRWFFFCHLHESCSYNDFINLVSFCKE